MLEQGGDCRFRHPGLELGKELMEQVDTQKGRPFHQPELLFILYQAQVADEGSGEWLKKSSAVLTAGLCGNAPDRQPSYVRGRRRSA